MGGNNDFFENFEEKKYLKKIPSMQRVNPVPGACSSGRHQLLARNQVVVVLDLLTSSTCSRLYTGERTKPQTIYFAPKTFFVSALTIAITLFLCTLKQKSTCILVVSSVS